MGGGGEGWGGVGGGGGGRGGEKGDAESESWRRWDTAGKAIWSLNSTHAPLICYHQLPSGSCPPLADHGTNHVVNFTFGVFYQSYIYYVFMRCTVVPLVSNQGSPAQMAGLCMHTLIHTIQQTIKGSTFIEITII